VSVEYKTGVTYVFPDEADAAAVAWEFIQSRGKLAYATEASVEITQKPHGGEGGATTMLWVKNQLTAITTVARNDRNWSVLVLQDLKPEEAPEVVWQKIWTEYERLYRHRGKWAYRPHRSEEAKEYCERRWHQLNAKIRDMMRRADQFKRRYPDKQP
jgi:hypothetical protein